MNNYYKIKFADNKSTVILTLGEILDAIEKNGLPQARGSYWEHGNSRFAPYHTIIVAACAIGMAAINLRIDWQALDTALRSVKLKNGSTLSAGIEYHNDEKRESFAKIADIYKKQLADRLNEPVSIETTRIEILD